MSDIRTVLPIGTYILNRSMKAEVMHGNGEASLAVHECVMKIEAVKEEPKGVFHVVCSLGGERSEYTLER